VSQRLDLVDSLFGLDGASEVVATITHQVNGRPVFLLARTVDESVALNTLAGQRVVTKVAEGDNWIIARLNTP
jgi:hypothetical protein